MDKLAHLLKNLSENEKHSLKTSEAYDKMSIGFTQIADGQDEAIESFSKVLEDLAQYQTICQNSKEEIKNQITLRDKEFTKRKNLEKSPKKTENEVMLSNMQSSRILKEIFSISEQFEKQKNSDFKEFFASFVVTQLKYHAMCLEVFTELYGSIDEIDVAQDSEVKVDFFQFFMNFIIFVLKIVFSGKIEKNQQGKLN